MGNTKDNKMQSKKNFSKRFSFTLKWLMATGMALSQLACPELVGLVEELKKPEKERAETDAGAKAAASAQGILHFNGIPSGSSPSPVLNELKSADVFIVYTNLHPSKSFDIPNGNSSGVVSASMHSIHSGNFQLRGSQENTTIAPYNIVPKHIRDFNASPIPLVKRPLFSTQGSQDAYATPSQNLVGSTTRTWRTSAGTVSTVLRAQANLSNGKEVLVWVGTNDYSTNENEDKKMTPNRINMVVKKFGTDSANIYDMDRKIFGQEWGNHSYNNLIPPTQNQIHIVYYDIGNNGPWGVLGYFWAVNNVKDHSSGNNALVFFMDSATMGLMQNGRWDVTMRGPGVMLTTLAHEFQHMIHFYEKSILNQTASPTWLNELASTTSEDMLANYITGSMTGPLFGNGGRFSQFAATPVCTLTNWSNDMNQQNDCNIFDSYAHVTSFGTFLARHYLGSENKFFKELLASKADSTASLGQAILRAAGTANPTIEQGSNKFAEAFQRWGASIVLNKAKREIPKGYGYPARRVPNFFAQGKDLILDEANIWSFSSQYNPRIYNTPPQKIRPLSHIVVRHKKGFTAPSLDMGAEINGFSNRTDLQNNPNHFKTTIVVQAH